MGIGKEGEENEAGETEEGSEVGIEGRGMDGNRKGEKEGGVERRERGGQGERTGCKDSRRGTNGVRMGARVFSLLPAPVFLCVPFHCRMTTTTLSSSVGRPTCTAPSAPPLDASSLLSR